MIKKRLLSGAFLSLLLSSTLLLAFCQSAPARAAASWNVQTVDSNAAGIGSNGYCPIVVDSNNMPSIAYTGADGVMYATWNSSLGGFSTQRIAIGYAIDMALDANNNPSVLCEAFRAGVKPSSLTDASLMYASWTGLNWTIQTVDPAYTVYAALALDSQGNPHAAYSSGRTLIYASRSGSTWTIDTADYSPDFVTEISFYSLALDSNDKPYIFYSNPTKKIATLENGSWNIETVPLPAFSSPDSIVGVGNMVLDSKGRPHFIYCVGSFYDSALKYVSWTGGSWKTQTVASGLHFDEQNPGVLALDSLDYPHICFSSGRLMYAAWTGLDWSIQTVDSAVGRNSGFNPVYLAVDSNRIPHVSYRAGDWNAPTNNQMYATASEPVPLASPLLIVLPLLLVLAAVIGALALLLYLKTRKR
jgi:hypothetical protein